MTFFWSPESKPHGRFFGNFFKQSRGLPPDDYGKHDIQQVKVAQLLKR